MTAHKAAERCRTSRVETSYVVATPVALILEIMSLGAAEA